MILLRWNGTRGLSYSVFAQIKKKFQGALKSGRQQSVHAIEFPRSIYIVNTVSLVGKQLFNTLAMISLQFN